jgi:hypothetical protein
MLTFPKTPITDSSFKKWSAIKYEEDNASCINEFALVGW